MDEHFAENFILRRDASTRKLYVVFDKDSIGKYALLTVIDTVIFAGYLPQSIYLGFDDTLNTKSLLSALRLHINEGTDCLN
jgi:hypothetical protein